MARGDVPLFGCEVASSKRDAAEAACDRAWPVLPFHVVVLTDHADAPRSATLPCPNTDWPCVLPAALEHWFLMQWSDGRVTPVCTDPANPDTCVRVELGAHLTRADVQEVSSSCDSALLLADAPATNYDEFSDYADALVQETARCGRPMVRPDMLNVYLYDSTFPGKEIYSFNGDTRAVVEADPSLRSLVIVFFDVARLPEPGMQGL